MTLSNRVAIQQEFTKLNHRIQDLKISMVIDDLIHQANEGSVQHLVFHTLPFYLLIVIKNDGGPDFFPRLLEGTFRLFRT